MWIKDLVVGELYCGRLNNGRQLAYLSPGGTGNGTCGIGWRDVALYLGRDKKSLQHKFWHLGDNVCVWCDTVEWLTPKTDQDDS